MLFRSTRADQHSGNDAARCRPPPKEESLLHMLRIAAPRSNSRCLLSTVIQQQTHLLGLKARSAPGRRTRSEGRNSAVGAPVCRHLITGPTQDRKSTRLNSSHTVISYAVFCLKKKTK